MSTFITTEYSLDEVADIGSDFAYAKVVTGSTGADTSPADTWGEMPARESHEAVPTFGENTKETEGGNKRVTSTTEDWALKYVTGQISKQVLYDLPKNLKGRTVLMVLELNDEPINGKHLYAAVLVKFKSWSGWANKKSPEFNFEILKATDDVDITVSAANFPRFAGDFTTPPTLTITDGEFYGLIEVNAPA